MLFLRKDENKNIVKIKLGCYQAVFVDLLEIHAGISPDSGSTKFLLLFLKMSELYEDFRCTS